MVAIRSTLSTTPYMWSYFLKAPSLLLTPFLLELCTSASRRITQASFHRMDLGLPWHALQLHFLDNELIVKIVHQALIRDGMRIDQRHSEYAMRTCCGQP